MNNAINEIKITLEGTMSRITETEDKISEVEDKMVEINEVERKKEKRIKHEEEIGNLSEKEFRIMIMKMIQNLENKMELQINNLETRIEKMQEMFNKDLEEIKKSQLKMNNALNEIKNTLEGTNSRITEAEDRISEV